MKLGLDLDGVTFDFVGALRADLQGRDPARFRDLPDPDRYEMWKGWGLTEAEWQEQFDRAVVGGLFARTAPYAGAVATLEKLRTFGWKIHIFTQRSASERSHYGTAAVAFDTLRALRHQDVPHDSVTFCEDKAAFVEACDVWLEDSAHVAERLARSSSYYTEVLLLNRPWNRTISPTGVRRVGSWDEVLEYLVFRDTRA